MLQAIHRVLKNRSKKQSLSMLQISDKLMFTKLQICYFSHFEGKKTTILFCFFSFMFGAFWRAGRISGNAHFLCDFFILGFNLLVYTGF